MENKFSREGIVKVWIIGNQGMLGQDLVLAAEKRGWEVLATDREVDICDLSVLEEWSADKDFAAMVNCAAYTAVDKAEEDYENAERLNGLAPQNLAQIAKAKNVPLVHISTDYVLNGVEGTPLVEEAPYEPVNAYGRSKRIGEEAITENWEKHYILRTAWLYGANGPSFVKAMLSLMASKEELNIVDDQQGCPTWTRDLAECVLDILEKEPAYGIYHTTGTGQTTWFGFAQKIQEQGVKMGLLEKAIPLHPVSSDQFPTPAKRPHWSVLSSEKLGRNLGRTLPLWSDSLESFLKAGGPQS
jgi:dTDP-4-dehydrorhamnose reductase